jgi:hypothetical protein
MIEEVIRYGGIYNHSLVTTTDETPTEIGNIPVDVNVSGLLIVDVHAMVSDGSAVSIGRYAVKYINDSSLTIGTKQTIAEDSTVSVSFADDGSGNVSIVGTGIAATTITWICRTQNLYQIISALL